MLKSRSHTPNLNTYSRPLSSPIATRPSVVAQPCPPTPSGEPKRAAPGKSARISSPSPPRRHAWMSFCSQAVTSVSPTAPTQESVPATAANRGVAAASRRRAFRAGLGTPQPPDSDDLQRFRVEQTHRALTARGRCGEATGAEAQAHDPSVEFCRSLVGAVFPQVHAAVVVAADQRVVARSQGEDRIRRARAFV